MSEKHIRCPSALCLAPLALDVTRFGITHNEDGTWTAASLIRCTFCNLVFGVANSCVEFVRVHYPTIEEMKSIERYQE